MDVLAGNGCHRPADGTAFTLRAVPSALTVYCPDSPCSGSPDP